MPGLRRPGSACGEGLSRAFAARFAPVRDDTRPPAWWLRALTLPLLGRLGPPLLGLAPPPGARTAAWGSHRRLGLAPPLLGLLVASPTLASINDRSGGWGG